MSVLLGTQDSRKPRLSWDSRAYGWPLSCDRHFVIFHFGLHWTGVPGHSKMLGVGAQGSEVGTGARVRLVQNPAGAKNVLARPLPCGYNYGSLHPGGPTSPELHCISLVFGKYY